MSRHLSFRQSLPYLEQQSPPSVDPADVLEEAVAFYEGILVEGLFDYAVLWQAGFRHLTCALGTHFNACQFRQLCDGPRTVYLTFDVDANGSGQQAAQQLAHRLRAQGIATCRVLLPQGARSQLLLRPGW